MNFATDTALTDLMKIFIAKCIAGSEAIVPMALGLLGVLATIELALLYIYNTMDGSEDPFFLLVKRLIKYSFFVWLIENWGTGMRLTKQIFDWFTQMGALAAGSSKTFSDPALIGDIGVQIALSIFDTALGLGLGSMGLLIMKLFLCITLFLIFAYMAIMIFCTTMQFYVLSTLTTALLPFGANKYTSFLSQPIFGAICNISIKMMFMQFALCISAPYLDTVQPFTAETATVTKILQTIVACIGMALFCTTIPEIAANYFTGSPTLGDNIAGSAGNSMRSMASAAASVPGNVAKVGMQAAGVVQAAANAPGGHSPGGKMDMAGTARNLGRMARQSMPDRQAQQHAKVLFGVSRSLDKDNRREN